MIIKESGHIYELSQVHSEGGKCDEPQVLKFVNREAGTEHDGTQTQEVLRALIDRTMHCDNCLRWDGNDLIIYHLRMALVLHEARALLRKTEKGLVQPENLVVADADGHYAITQVIGSEDSKTYHSKKK